MALFPKDRTRRDMGREDAYCCIVIVPSLVETVRFKNHRITEWLRLEGISGDHLV